MATITGGFSATRRRSASEASPLQHIDVLLLALPFVDQRARPADDLFVDPDAPRAQGRRPALLTCERQGLAIGLGRGRDGRS